MQPNKENSRRVLCWDRWKKKIKPQRGEAIEDETNGTY